MMSPNQEQLENRAKWLAALRSGEYSQCQSQLYDNGSYCCLGVDARLANKLEEDGRFVWSGCSDSSYALVEDEWFAERHGVTVDEAMSITDRAVQLNDSMGTEFPQIADEMERLFALCDEGTFCEDWQENDN